MTARGWWWWWWYCTVLCVDVEGFVCAASLLVFSLLYRQTPCPRRYPFDWRQITATSGNTCNQEREVPTYAVRRPRMVKALCPSTLQAWVLEKLLELEDNSKRHQNEIYSSFSSDTVEKWLLVTFTLRYVILVLSAVLCTILDKIGQFILVSFYGYCSSYMLWLSTTSAQLGYCYQWKKEKCKRIVKKGARMWSV